MTDTMMFTPTLSPGFARARKLSRIMAVLFTIGFWVMVLMVVLLLTIPVSSFCPNCTITTVGLEGITVSLNGLSFAQHLWVLLALETIVVPVVFLMHHTRRVFGHFAKGEIFVLPVIAHIRRAGLWLIVCFFANIGGQLLLHALRLMPPGQAKGSTWPLNICLVTVIAAYVMEEGRRIAADHAEII